MGLNFHSRTVVIFLICDFFIQVYAKEWEQNTMESGDQRESYKIIHHATTWTSAQGFCRFRGWRLPEIYSYEQQNKLRALIRTPDNLCADSGTGYWLGGRLINGEWQWDSEGQKFMSANNDLYKAGWHFGKPSTTDMNKMVPQCLEMQYVNGSKFVEALSWNNLPCDEKRKIICEKIPRPPVPDAN